MTSSPLPMVFRILHYIFFPDVFAIFLPDVFLPNIINSKASLSLSGLFRPGIE